MYGYHAATRQMRISSLLPGDPWTFCSSSAQKIIEALNAGVGGRMTHEASVDEASRVFEIVQIDQKTGAIETRYLGFELRPGTKLVKGEEAE